jgi:hypothetical protein
MIRSPVGRVLALVLVLFAVLALVVGAYNFGLSAGAAAAGAGAAAVPHAWGYAFAGGYGFPWFFVWPIFPILFIVFVALLFRAVVWGREPWGRGPGGPESWGRGQGVASRGTDDWHDTRPEDDPPARFEEWHRRAHAADGPDTTTSGRAHPGQA